MYFITVMEPPKIRRGEAYPGTSRCWGYYEDIRIARQTVVDNVTDLHEGIYHYAIIENIPPGIAQFPTEQHWFEWDEEQERYYGIDRPKWAHKWCNFSIG